MSADATTTRSAVPFVAIATLTSYLPQIPTERPAAYELFMASRHELHPMFLQALWRFARYQIMPVRQIVRWFVPASFTVAL